MTGAPYELAIVEFDDQGRCYDRGQMDAVADRLEALAPDDPSKGQDVDSRRFRAWLEARRALGR